MAKHRLYKFFSERRWAEAMLDGNLLFRPLSYFQSIEDGAVRGDAAEGSADYRPEAGLTINNMTQGTTFTIPGSSFKSKVRAEKVLVFCLSMSRTQRHQDEFGACCCIEVTSIGEFCARIQRALPAQANLIGSPERPRIGSKVRYYAKTADVNPRWALPEVMAVSKQAHYAWQDEFRLIYSLTEALGFENVDTSISLTDGHLLPVSEGTSRLIQAGDMSDFCRVHDF